MVLNVVVVVVKGVKRTSTPLPSSFLLLRLPALKSKVKCLQVVAMVGLVDGGDMNIGDNYDDSVDDDDGGVDDKCLGNSECRSLGHFPFRAEERMAFQCLISGCDQINYQHCHPHHDYNDD